MAKNTCKILAFAFLLLAGAVSSWSNENSPTPESLIAQARKLQDIWSDRTPPIAMRAEIQLFDSKGKVISGGYHAYWVSPSRWREELEISNYRRLRVHDAKGYWQQSTLNIQPEIIFQLDSLLDFKTVLNVGGKQFLSKVKNRGKDGVRQNCTEVKWIRETERILCFDDANGNLLSVEYPRSEHRNPPDISRIEYSAFRTVGERRIPFEIRAVRDRTVVATVKVLEMVPITDENPSLFVAPANSELWPRCDDVQAAELLNHVQPTYPINARSNHEYGKVSLYAVIEPDGTLSHLTIIRKATPALEAAALEAVRQWRYRPASCGSTPVRMETSISVDFWLDR